MNTHVEDDTSSRTESAVCFDELGPRDIRTAYEVSRVLNAICSLHSTRDTDACREACHGHEERSMNVDLEDDFTRVHTDAATLGGTFGSGRPRTLFESEEVRDAVHYTNESDSMDIDACWRAGVNAVAAWRSDP